MIDIVAQLLYSQICDVLVCLGQQIFFLDGQHTPSEACHAKGGESAGSTAEASSSGASSATKAGSSAASAPRCGSTRREERADRELKQTFQTSVSERSPPPSFLWICDTLIKLPHFFYQPVKWG